MNLHSNASLRRLLGNWFERHLLLVELITYPSAKLIFDNSA